MRPLPCLLPLLLLAAFSLPAAGLGVATWNVGWLLDASAHARWVEACGKLGWPANAMPDGLPYCNVHNGMAFPPEACASGRDQWPQKARYPDDHPCRDTLDLVPWPRYSQKLSELRAMFRRLDELGVHLVALQEVFDERAVRAILPPHWSAVTTREMAGSPAIAQHVGVAWRTGTAVRAFEAVNTLSDSGAANRPLRPGLAFTVDVGGKPVRALVVHLKAGCRSRDLDAPLVDKDMALPPERKDLISSDCAILRYQLPALERWIDGNAAHDFAVLGDFNRTLLREPVAESRTYRTRLDGSAASDPLGTCTLARDGNRTVARCATRTRAMFPELNDAQPAGAVLWRARFADLGRGGTIAKGSSGDCTIKGRRGDLTHDGIDHIVISASLKQRLAPDALTMRVVNYQDEQQQPLRAARDRALPSDHCPHVVTWTPR